MFASSGGIDEKYPRPVIAYRMWIFYNYEMVFRTAII